MKIRSKSMSHVFALLASLSGSMFFVTPVFAVNIVVTTANYEIDGNFCGDYDYTGGTGISLPEAICSANGIGGANTITFAVNVFTLGDRLPSVSSTIIMNGNGAAITLILAAATPGVANQRIVQVLSTGNLTLNNLTIAHGRCNGGCINQQAGSGVNPNAGGAILNHGTLSVTNSRFHGNTSSFSNGGGIYNTPGGILNVSNSTFSSNRVGDFGSGGGIFNAGTATVTNSTLQDNTAVNGNGGGLFNDGTANLLNSTLSANRSINGIGGVFNNGTLHYSNSIIANATTGVDCFDIGVISTNINNLVEDNSCSPALSGDPNLGALVNNGGPTLTMALLLTPTVSPAINSGDNNSCEATDQRGVSRPQGTTCDIGAYEAELPEIHVVPGQLDQVLLPDTIEVQQLSIENTGAIDLDWTIDELDLLNHAGTPPERTVACSSPVDIAWLSLAPGSGTTAPGGTDFIDVTFDATGLVTGNYSGVLCVNSNDPDAAIVEVPVALAVVNPIPLVCNGVTMDFESRIPFSFSTTATGNTNVKWVTTADDTFCGGSNWSGINETPGSGEAACVDADLNNPAPSEPYDARMMSNSFDLSQYISANLNFAAAYQDIGNADAFDVDISTNGGGTWTNELHWDENHYSPGENVNINLAAYLGQTDVRIRFRYHGTGWDWWAEVDDISLSCIATEGISSDSFEDIELP